MIENLNGTTKEIHGYTYQLKQSLLSSELPIRLFPSSSTSCIELTKQDNQYILSEWIRK